MLINVLFSTQSLVYIYICVCVCCDLSVTFTRQSFSRVQCVSGSQFQIHDSSQRGKGKGKRVTAISLNFDPIPSLDSPVLITTIIIYSNIDGFELIQNLFFFFLNNNNNNTRRLQLTVQSSAVKWKLFNSNVVLITLHQHNKFIYKLLVKDKPDIWWKHFSGK